MAMMATSVILEQSIKRFGLSQVHTPSGEVFVDVVFVHGLNGHPYDTWTSEKSKIFWPGELLPPIVEKEKARILVYGYDADVTSFTDGVSKDKIHNHAEGLVAELCANRRMQKATERPIVFVAHSLGGLVVKRALIYSSGIRNTKTEHLRSIFVSTYGTLFLGTPHRGSDLAEWGSRLERICGAILPKRLIDTQPQLINALKSNSETLQNIDRDFIQLTSRLHIFLFHEGKPTDLKGTLRYVVSEESASPNIQDVERACIQQDHSHMCKFENASAPGFHLVTEGIQRYAGQALEIIVSRWNWEKAQQLRRKVVEVEELLPRELRLIEDTALSTSALPGRGTSKRRQSPRPTAVEEDLSTLLVIWKNANMRRPDLSKALRPLFLVPFSRDNSFVNRIEIFNDINKHVKQHHRLALAGVGGVGKSQIAIEYCYRFQKDHPHAQIVWVHASTKPRFDQAYRDIARRLDLPGWNDPNVDTLRLVLEWFNEDDNGSWLMVLDNADDLDMFFTKPNSTATDSEGTRPLAYYLPQSSKGSMLITTRDERVGGRLAGRHACIVVEPMSAQEAQELLANGRTDSDRSDLEVSTTLLEALEYLPLAITQAAAFISENHITDKEYLDMFQASDSDVQDLLEEDFGDLRRDSESQNSVIRTWKLSFDLISKQKPRAAEILSLMAVLDRQGIMKSLLRNETDRDIDLTMALGTLLAFSLIKAGRDGAGYEMHRLVQLATRKWLDIQGNIKLWQEKAFSVVVDNFPDGIFENWTTCESLLPHAQTVIQYGDADGLCPEDHANLLSCVARFDLEQGRYEIACIRYLAAIEVQKKTFGLDHDSTLTWMNNLAETYREQGRWEEAEKLHMQVLEARKRVLGAEHPDTLQSMNNLAITYRNQGRWDEAEKLHMQVLEARKRVLGAEHPETLISMNNLAVTYEKQGRWEEAEKLHMQVLEARKRVLGSAHPNMLQSMNNLAVTYEKQGRWEEAEKLHMQVLEARKRVLGPEHPDTLTSMHNLACVHNNQNRHSEAITLMRVVVELCTKILGANHPDTIKSVECLKEWVEAKRSDDGGEAGG